MQEQYRGSPARSGAEARRSPIHSSSRVWTTHGKLVSTLRSQRDETRGAGDGDRCHPRALRCPGGGGGRAEPAPSSSRRVDEARPSGTVSMWRHPRTRLALGAAAIAFAGWVVAGALGAVIGGATALGFQAIRRRRSRAKRAERLEQQLVEAVSVISSGLRVGQSLVQAIALAGKEVAPPLGPMLAEAADCIALGASFERTMEQWTGRIGTPEARLVAAVLGLHRRTGGDLAALLDRLGNTLRDRLAAAAEVRSLTAQARLSGTILGWLPIGFFVFMATTSRQDISAAYRSPLGATAIALGLLMQGAAYLWIRRLLVVES